MTFSLCHRREPTLGSRMARTQTSFSICVCLPPAKKSKAPYALVINIHGGFWRAKYNLDHAGHLCAALTARGLATANLEYRRVGNDGGAWPGTFSDIRSAYHFLVQNAQAHDLDSRRIMVMGHSAGGQLALCLAAHESSITRVISLAGVVDLQRAYQLHLSNDAVVEFLRGTPSRGPRPLPRSRPHGAFYCPSPPVADPRLRR